MYRNIIELSEPIAAASIAQVHIAKIKIDNSLKEVAVKIVKKKELSLKDIELLKREIEVLKIC